MTNKVGEKIKQIPYGLANYERLVQKNCYYVDKTMYLGTIKETGDYFRCQANLRYILVKKFLHPLIPNRNSKIILLVDRRFFYSHFYLIAL